MLEPGDVNPREVPLIQEIVRNETWLMGERVGHPVDPKSPEVLSKVVEIILTLGAEWRTKLERFGSIK